MSVDLPAPFGPMHAMRDACDTWTETSSSVGLPLRVLHDGPRAFSSALRGNVPSTRVRSTLEGTQSGMRRLRHAIDVEQVTDT